MSKEKEIVLLCIDIGNTSISYGVFRKEKFEAVQHSPTNNFPQLIPKIANIHRLFPIDYALVSSVVPKITRIIRKSIKRNLLIAGDTLEVPLRHKYLSIKKLGSDRLVNAYGGMKHYGRPLLIFDFGTALTCDYVSSRGIFEGGLIIPGPEVSWKALTEKAVLLPKISFPKPSRRLPLIGRDTKTGMEAGILQGYAALADGLIERFRLHYKTQPRVVATGGLAKAIYPHSSRIDVLDPLLTLRALVEIFRGQLKMSS